MEKEIDCILFFLQTQSKFNALYADIEAHFKVSGFDSSHEHLTTILFYMRQMNYLNSNDDNTGGPQLTSQGLQLCLDGGLVAARRRRTNQNRLYIIGQWSLVIAALYYALETLKFLYNLFPCSH